MKPSRLFLSALALFIVTLLQVQASTPNSPVGKWKWANDNIIELKQDSKVYEGSNQIATWKWVDEGKLEFAVVWPTGRKDTLKLSADGNAASGVDADGGAVSGVRIPVK